VIAEREQEGATLLAPCTPSKVVCVGRNYAAHARELGNPLPTEPLLFLKPPSSIIGPGQAIKRPVSMSGEVHHEGELAVVLGARLRHANVNEARAAVFGYTIANDVTARDIQRAENKFTRAKGFDTFCPLGPALLSAAAIPDAGELELEVRVCGQLRQHGRTADMVFSVPTLLAYISRVMTLEPGDVVLTGTPEGVGPLVAGDLVEISISGLGILRNPVEDDAGPV
jgi:2-keto-4-pentenoate hydratase/2-oxohepta-3-ene-1,7-dioic acid hydratase in catechol pathway